MASGDQYDVLKPINFIATNGPSLIPQLVPIGSYAGLPLAKLDTQYYVAEFRAVAGVATGITIQTGLVEDSANADPGRVVRLGITIKVLASGTDTYDITTGAATEVTADVTMDATSGEVVLTNTAITAANADSIAAGSRALIAIRRVGSHANDTHRGRVILTGVTIRDT